MGGSALFVEHGAPVHQLLWRKTGERWGEREIGKDTGWFAASGWRCSGCWLRTEAGGGTVGSGYGRRWRVVVLRWWNENRGERVRKTESLRVVWVAFSVGNSRGLRGINMAIYSHC